MSFALSHRFSVDATGRPVVPPTPSMAAAAQAYSTGDHAEAKRLCLGIIQHDSRHFDALHLLGVVCLDSREYADAIRYLSRAARERSDNPRVHYHIGSAWLGQKQYERAEAALRRALQLDPNDANVLNNLGNVLGGMGRHDEAVACYRQALGINPALIPARFNLGRSLAVLNRFEEAVASFREALAGLSADRDPDRWSDVHAGLAQVLANLGRYDEAIAACGAIAEARPQIADWNESLILLLLGHYEEGWRKYESRWGIADHDPPRADARVPMLAEVAGKRVLLIPEQGHGDMIQFARYAALLAAQGARVIVQTYVELTALLGTLQGIDQVIAPNEKEPTVDIITPLLSLPLVFDTHIDTIPAQVPYLHAPPERLADWQRRLGSARRPRVGLAWWGSQHIPQRSLPFELLFPLLSLPGIEFHALQKEIPAAQRESMVGRPIIDHSEELNDYADTAALISLLDLVVTIDTSVAHVAGALGKPVWIMLPHNADWRWLLDREDSPWYPTARLFRQKQAGNWEGVVADVLQRLPGVALAE